MNIQGTAEKIQEAEYFLPYHWMSNPSTFEGRVYAGYRNICLSLLDPVQGNVLDAGCGDGRFLGALRDKKVSRLFGVDFSERAISFAKIFVPEADVQAADIAHLPYEDNFFDAVFLIEVLEHIPPQEIADFVSGLYRVIKPGGQLIVSTPSIATPPPEKHYQHFSEALLEKTLSGFEIRTIVWQGAVHEGLRGIIYKLFDNRFWNIQLLARWYNLSIWPKFFNRVSPGTGERIIVKCYKK